MAIRQVAATMRNANDGAEPIERATNCASETTPRAAKGARTTWDRRKNRCRTNNAAGAVLRFRSLIHTKKGPAKTNAIKLNQKYQRASLKARIAPIIMSSALTDPNERPSTAILSHGDPPM